MLCIDALRLDVDFIAGTCHKGLLPLPGLGFLHIIKPDLVDGLLQGSGGFNSKDFRHPSASPLKFEAGTPNYFAIAGLDKTLEYLHKNRERRFYQFVS
jgi:cysteine desulfurase / selenocysteine lyase